MSTAPPATAYCTCKPGSTVWLTGSEGTGHGVARALAEGLAARHRRVEVLAVDAAGSEGTGSGAGADGADDVRRVGRIAQVLAANGVTVLVPVARPGVEDTRLVGAWHEKSRAAFVEVPVSAPTGDRTVAESARAVLGLLTERGLA
ncbi:adenylyl-sulfate kinase [Streptomyces sp. NPDC048057]|uniref:adenylyl-sulfate kinase n=1 Tax=Streptomyces sp. NPDC048057 TaxID=3155628 RepID=UPI0033DA61B7